MDRMIQPRKLGGTIAAIPSKSDAHRRLICAVLAGEASRVELGGGSKDINATANALCALGAQIERDAAGYAVRPIGAGIAQGGNSTGASDAHDQSVTVDCGESGSTLRFLLPVAAALGLDAIFVGSGRLPERPMQVLCALLRAHGVAVDADFLPIHIFGKLQSGRYELPGDVSSQYISGLLFALPLLAGDSEIVLTAPLESAGYVEMTIRALAAYGVAVQATDTGWRIAGGQVFRARKRAVVEGDWSNAAFWVVVGALGSAGDGVPVVLTGLPADSAQGDRAILDIARLYGAVVAASGETVTVTSGAARTEPIEIDARDIPDLVPVLGVLACGAYCVTTITGCARLRLKESDRIEAVCGMLTALGGDARADGDRIVIVGHGSLRGGEVDSRNDHRIAMAAAVASSICTAPVALRDAQAVEKSYPAFWRDFESMGGKANVL